MNLPLADEPRHRRLRWRCRRGMRELDQLLERRLDRLLATGDKDALTRFERLLESEDDQLWRWSLGHETPVDPDIAKEIDAIRSHDPA